MSTDSVGTGKTHPTWVIWEAQLGPTLDEHEVGEGYKNDELSAELIFAGITVGIYTITMTAAAGESFVDNFVPGTDPLEYDPVNGAALKNTGNYSTVVKAQSFAVIVTRLQFHMTGGGAVHLEAGGSIDQCLIVCDTSRNDKFGVLGKASMSNVLVYMIGSSGTGLAGGYNAGTIDSCSFIRSTDETQNRTGITSNSSYTPIIKNCCIFGFDTAPATNFSGSSKNNATELTSGLPGSNNQHSVTYSATRPFVDAADSTSYDLSVTAASDAGGDLESNGDTTLTVDILGQTRAATDTDKTIGCYEIVAAPAAAGFAPRHPLLSRRKVIR